MTAFVFENGDQLFFELATTLNNLGTKWLSEKKINFTPWISGFLLQNDFQKLCTPPKFIKN